METWAGAQEYYIQYHAQCIIVTAASSMVPILRGFRPEHLIIDDASQLTEHAAGAVMSRFSDFLDKVSIIGDPFQTQPFVASTAEFVRTNEISLMQRLVETGVPYTFLKVQYRIYPHISRSVSRLFYSDKLVDAASVMSRPGDSIWRDFMSHSMPSCAPRHSVFVNVPSSTLFRTKRGLSTINPNHLVAVRQGVARLKFAGAVGAQIAILTPYEAQLRLHRKLPDSGDITMATMDSSQGKEYEFVILDLVTHGGRNYPLGFVTDVKRMCVGLSRAKSGLLIVGNKSMSQLQYRTVGVKAWDN